MGKLTQKHKIGAFTVVVAACLIVLLWAVSFPVSGEQGGTDEKIETYGEPGGGGIFPGTRSTASPLPKMVRRSRRHSMSRFVRRSKLTRMGNSLLPVTFLVNFTTYTGLMRIRSHPWRYPWKISMTRNQMNGPWS